jgi:hypothetical protein
MESKFHGSHLTVLFKALATQGPGWALTRAHIALSNKFGVLERRLPLHSWGDLSLASLLKTCVPSQGRQYYDWRLQNSPQFLFEEFPPTEASFIGQGSIRLADGILDGNFPFFGYTQHLGFLPAWQHNPLNHARALGGHWSKIREFDSGDIKLWWEGSRFSWAFALARAFTRTQDERYAEAFWQLLESWLEEDPPQWGVNWKCGQEASFRTMALCFAFYAFTSSASSTPGRMTRFVTVMAIHAKRIAAYIEFAQSQKNNHGISEGVGLWTIGLLFPELQGADVWKARGKQVIESEICRQIYADGSYIQHSTNYHRVMLHDLAWAIRLGECNNDLFASDTYERFRKSIRFLYALTDPKTGWGPNYGANDGALVLPLSDCDYPDLRPVLQCCHFIAEKERLYPPGPWDEEMVWLNSIESLGAKQSPESGSSKDLNAMAGGYYTIHSGGNWAMFRGAKYKDRPSHADQLHMDLWWHGENILCDAGTYSYNGEFPFDDGFASTRYHNTITVDAADQMTRLGRFLWADWAHANVIRYRTVSAESSVLEGEHDGYERIGVVHRRAVAKVNFHTWIVVDDLVGNGEHDLRLHWLLPDVPFQLVATGIVDLKFNAGNVRMHLLSGATCSWDVVRAGQQIAGDHQGAVDPTRGWTARYYARKDPALSIMVESRSSLPVRFVTVVMLGEIGTVEMKPPYKSLLLDSKLVNLSAVGVSPIFIREQP